MKTIKKVVKGSMTYKRLDDVKAAVLITNGWNYCPKSEWKEFKAKKSGEADNTVKADKKTKRANKRSKIANR